MAVLARTWRELYALETQIKCAAGEEIPTAVGRPGRAWSSNEAQDLSRWLRLQLNPADDNLAALLVGRDTAPLLRREARAARTTVWAAATARDWLPGPSPDGTSTRLIAEKLLTGREDWHPPAATLAELDLPSRRTLRGFRWWWQFGREPTRTPGAVQLSTVHGVKGLEFDVVFVMNPDQMDELEVRYTALTRARDRLFLVGSLDPEIPW